MGLSLMRLTTLLSPVAMFAFPFSTGLYLAHALSGASIRRKRHESVMSFVDLGAILATSSQEKVLQCSWRLRASFHLWPSLVCYSPSTGSSALVSFFSR